MHLNEPSLGISASDQSLLIPAKGQFPFWVGENSRFKTHRRHEGRPTWALPKPELSLRAVRHVFGKCSADISPRRHRHISTCRPIRALAATWYHYLVPQDWYELQLGGRERQVSQCFGEPFVLCVPVVYSGGVVALICCCPVKQQQQQLLYLLLVFATLFHLSLSVSPWWITNLSTADWFFTQFLF